METKEWVKPGRRTARPIKRRIKQSYYFFYRTQDGKYSPIERYQSKEKVQEVLKRIAGRKIIVDRFWISNSADFIKFLNRMPSISLGALAKEIGIEPSAMSKLTNGKLNLSRSYATKLAPALNKYGWTTTVDELLRGCKNRITGSVAKTKNKEIKP